MPTKRLGRQTIRFSSPPALLSYANCVGKKEGEGPLGACFDYIAGDDSFDQATWEKAEQAMQKQALTLALDKAGLSTSGLDFLYAGDLLNQCISSAYAARGQDVPYLGLYGACSTMGEGTLLAAMALDGGFGSYAAATASSHFCSAERQYRNPLEYGGQRTPTAQWTVTGAGAVVLAAEGPGPYVTHATIGKIVDKGVTDANNMGAAMAPVSVKLTPYVTRIWYASAFFYTHFSEKGGHSGNNYLKLRDIGEAVGFNVYWDSEKHCVQIESDAPYPGVAPTANAEITPLASYEQSEIKPNPSVRQKSLRNET